MHCLAILQRHHTQVLPKFRNENPVTNAAIRLYFAADGLAQGSFAPFALDIRTFAQDLFFEVARCFHLPVKAPAIVIYEGMAVSVAAFS